MGVEVDLWGVPCGFHRLELWSRTPPRAHRGNREKTVFSLLIANELVRRGSDCTGIDATISPHSHQAPGQNFHPHQHESSENMSRAGRAQFERSAGRRPSGRLAWRGSTRPGSASPHPPAARRAGVQTVRHSLCISVQFRLFGWFSGVGFRLKRLRLV